MFHNDNRTRETNLTINYDVLQRPEEKIMVLLAFIGMPVNVTKFIHYANGKLQIVTTGDWLTNGTLATDLHFMTPDNSGELSVVFTGKPGIKGYSDDMGSLLNAIMSSPGMTHRHHWLFSDLTIDELVSLPEFGVLNSESKLQTLENYFGFNAAKLVAGYFVRHDEDLKARKTALGRFNDIYHRRRGPWTPESFLTQVELHVMAHTKNRRRDRDVILAEIREHHDSLLALANELGKL